MQLVEHSKLPKLFQQTFGPGKNTPVERTGMAEWLEAFTEVDEHLFVCQECGGHSLLPLNSAALENVNCFFCEAEVDEQLVLMEEFIYLVDKEAPGKSSESESNKITTGRKVCLQPGDQKELKRLMPSFSYDMVPSDHIRLEYDDTGLLITPAEPLYISRGDDNIHEFKKKTRLKTNTRGKNSEPYCIHLGNRQDGHVFWQFRW